MQDPREQTLQLEGGETYAVRTHRGDLRDAIQKMLPDVWHMRDVPDSFKAIGKGLKDLLDGSFFVDLGDGRSQTEQLEVVIPMLNALRLTYEAAGPDARDGCFWDEFRRQVDNVFAVMDTADPFVSWVALRNCWAYESKNLPSRSGNSFQGMEMIMAGGLTKSATFMRVFVRIKAEMAKSS